jgi:hypothetical protein
MRILIDECVDPRVAKLFAGHDVKTVHDMGYGSLRNQAQLARVVRGRLGRGRPLQVVEVGVEPADQLIELEGRLPNIEKQAAPRATAPDAALPVDGGIISLVPGAASFELSGSDLQGG